MSRIMWRSLVVLHLLLVSAISGGTRHHKVLETDCECGIRNQDDTAVISRGTFSENHAWPWMVSIVNATIAEEPVAYCGATLINDRYILTAAHCIPDMMNTGIDNFRLYLGTNYISNGTNFLNLGIHKIISHPQFDFDTAENDLALIKLKIEEKVIFTDYIKPICLRQEGHPFVGYDCYMTGWGSFNLSEPTEDSLKEAKAIVVPNEICATNYTNVDIPVTEAMICAHLQLPDDDPCKGDSGGPLLIKENYGEAYSQVSLVMEKAAPFWTTLQFFQEFQLSLAGLKKTPRMAFIVWALFLMTNSLYEEGVFLYCDKYEGALKIHYYFESQHTMYVQNYLCPSQV